MNVSKRVGSLESDIKKLINRGFNFEYVSGRIKTPSEKLAKLEIDLVACTSDKKSAAIMFNKNKLSKNDIKEVHNKKCVVLVESSEEKKATMLAACIEQVLNVFGTAKVGMVAYKDGSLCANIIREE